MWQLARTLQTENPTQAATMQELLRSTVYKLLTVSTAAWLIGAPLFSSAWSGPQILWLMAGLLGVGALFGLAYRVLARRYLLALTLWLVGMALALLLGSWLLRQPTLLLLASSFPLIAVLTVSGWAGVVTTAGVLGTLWAATQGLLGVVLPTPTAWIIAVVTLFNGCLAWSARSELFTVAQWSMSNVDAVTKRLAEARTAARTGPIRGSARRTRS
ncbi:MAG: hypothetical protein R2932_02335 [Caldilineaceae bacterium]